MQRDSGWQPSQSPWGGSREPSVLRGRTGRVPVSKLVSMVAVTLPQSEGWHLHPVRRAGRSLPSHCRAWHTMRAPSPQQGRGHELHEVLKNQHQTDYFSNPRVRFSFTSLPQPSPRAQAVQLPPKSSGLSGVAGAESSQWQGRTVGPWADLHACLSRRAGSLGGHRPCRLPVKTRWFWTTWFKSRPATRSVTLGKLLHVSETQNDWNSEEESTPSLRNISTIRAACHG